MTAPANPSPAALSQALAPFLSAARSGDKAGVARAARRLLEGSLPLGRQWGALANAMLHDGEGRLARDAARRLANEMPGPSAAFLRATILARSGEPEQAAAIVAMLPDNIPDAYAAAFFRASLATDLGQIDDAAEAYRRALSARPTGGEAWLGLAMLERLDSGDGVRLEELAAARGWQTPEEGAALHVALGRAREAAGDPEGAFAAYVQAGREWQAKACYDRNADLADARRLLALELQRPADAPTPDPSASPVFVTGLPRSGTTLVEQILASHSGFVEGGECEFLGQAARLVGSKDPAAARRFVHDQPGVESPAAHYLRLAAERFGPGRVVDKSLSTSRMVGFADALFPAARYVWLRRDLEDCAWSAFRSHFAKGVEWSHDIASIGTHFALEEALLAHWQAQLGDRMLVVDFAELASEPAPVITRLAAHCGVEVEPAMLAPHETRRAVTTSSALQVREPINTKGLGRAAPYSALMGPFRDALEQARAVLSR